MATPTDFRLPSAVWRLGDPSRQFIRCNSCNHYSEGNDRDRVRALAGRYVPTTDNDNERAASVVAAQIADVPRSLAVVWAMEFFRERTDKDRDALRKAGF